MTFPGKPRHSPTLVLTVLLDDAHGARVGVVVALLDGGAVAEDERGAEVGQRLAVLGVGAAVGALAVQPRHERAV